LDKAMAILRRVTAILVCLPAALAIHGQQGQVSGPIAGYVFAGAVLRPIAGVPGGATLGDALSLGLAATAAVVSPQLDSAIVTASDGSLHLFRPSGNTATEVSWNGVPQGPARVVYSPSGTAAAIYASGRVQVVSGLPNSPATSYTAEIGPAPETLTRQTIHAAPQAMAVSDDAAYLLVASEGRLRLLSASGSSSWLLDGVREVSVAFASGGHTAAVLSGAGPWLDVFPDVSADATQRIAAPGLAEPVGLAFSADGKSVLAAAHGSKPVTIFNLAAAGAATTLDCNCAPTTAARLGSLFRLTDAGAGPVWLVDTGVSPPRIVFVPARANP
jgi:DNA-binding beta-propeller fold protein YncE